MRYLALVLILLASPAWSDTKTMFGGNVTTNLNNAATNFIPGSGDRASGSTETNFQFPVPISGTATDMYCTYGIQGVGPGISPAKFALTLRKNASSTALTCDISGAATNDCSSTGASVALVAGDLVDFQSVPTSTPLAGVASCSVAVTITGGATPAIRPRPYYIMKLEPLQWFLQNGSHA